MKSKSIRLDTLGSVEWKLAGLGILEISRGPASPDLLPPDDLSKHFFSFVLSHASHLLHFFIPAQSNSAYESRTLLITPSYKMSVLRNIKNLAPLLDRVLVQRIKPEAKTASGIFLPESSVKEQNEAKVLAVGPGAVDRNGQRIPMSVAAGDKVLIPQFGGSTVKVGEEEYHLFRDSEILAKINE
ncbi:hypothetical protein KXV31_007118 [Aspergillus fumigatus]|nr:hypothetical protein KXX49_001178 [Aspergillus fumigatus]KAH1667868.1 hypothetical protein KXX65_009102 [Aspergillus fumigatus]KAH1810080.1 hypothetical protein KXX19_007737 [Aspergillus fumigatus]KAH2028267.1 hypothetical protein KXV65_005735 [Aspergillus fumigatus]KAH2071521.1 hypothetical protein KXW21_001065 [Aspergillus fumigatus]